ncbi:hypothetical protein IPC618_32875, partial [Pseudomonas aeruginosa]
MKKRWIQMDVTRGVGILIIVFGHSWFVASSPMAWFAVPLVFGAWNALLARYAYAAGDTRL